MLILLPILALVFLCWAPAPSESPRLRRLIFPILAIVIVWVFAIGLVPNRWKYPIRPSPIVAQIAVDHFRSTAETGRPIILLEGSSLTAYGINGEMIETLLRQRGIPVTVLQLSAPGANHYERLEMISEFLKSLRNDEREKLKASHVLLLREVLREYDENPMKYLEGDTLQRNLHYTDIPMFTKMWRTGSHLKDPVAFHWNLIKCTVLNAFGTGLLPGGKISAPSVPPSPYKGIDWGIPKSFNFEAAWNEFAAGYIRGDRIGKLEEKVPSETWICANSDLLEILGPYVDKVGYFATPVLSADEIRYQKAFLDSVSENHPKFGPAAPGLYQFLAKQNFWYDPRHTTLPGSVIVTMWLEAQLAAQWGDLFLPK